MGHRFSKTAANAAYTTTPVTQTAHQTFCCNASKRPIAKTSAMTATTTTTETTPTTSTNTTALTRTSTVTPAKSAICMANNSIVEETSSPLNQQMYALPETPLHITAHMNRLSALTNANDSNGECSLTTTTIDSGACATATATTSACDHFNPCERSNSNTDSNFNLNSNNNLFEHSLANSCYAKTATAAGILQRSDQNGRNHSHSLSSINNLPCGRQIIIKIQLAKMENGNGQTSAIKRQYQQLQASSSLSPLPSSTHLIESPTTDGNQNIFDDTLLINTTKAIPATIKTKTAATTAVNTAAEAAAAAAVPLAALMTNVLTTEDQQLNLSLNIEKQSPLSPLSTSLSTLWSSSHSSTVFRGTADNFTECTSSIPKDNFSNRMMISPNAFQTSIDTNSTIAPCVHNTCDLRTITPLFNTATTSNEKSSENRINNTDQSNGVGGVSAATYDDKNWLGNHDLHHLSGFTQFTDNEFKVQNTDETVDYYEVLEGNDFTIAGIAATEGQEAEATPSSSLSQSPLPPIPQIRISNNSNNNNKNTNGAATEFYAESKTTCCHRKCIKPTKGVAAPLLVSSTDRSSAASASAVGTVTKWRYRDVFRRLLEPVSLRACSKVKLRKDELNPIMGQSFGRKCKKQQSENLIQKDVTIGAAVATAAASATTTIMTASLLNKCLHSNTSFDGNVSQQEAIMTSTPSISLVSAASARSEADLKATQMATSTTNVTTTTTMAAVGSSNSHLSIWASNRNKSSDVVIPIATEQPQFVVVQCSILNAALDENVNSSTSNESGLPSAAVNSILTAAVDNSNEVNINPNAVGSLPNEAKELVGSSRQEWLTSGPVVHSQVDFCHHLVPDLERIIQSSFYWGKMDRYEAERLLEGNPEGTFLLRDSAQEEFLFSVTFRKYGRSLHARIEQSGHRFSFDCHDPCVFTASTVTGLLEHYKDPACVMFFEPMLTIPLHRKTCFSLQQLCRATIVSHITYDGINKLELPFRLKSYLKEYHYKQKLRVKPFDEPYYI